MAKMPPYSAVSRLTLGNRSLFTVEFKKGGTDKLNLIGGVFTATQVTIKGNEPEYDDMEFGPGIPLQIYKGSNQPVSVSIAFIDDDKDTLYRFINKWAATGKFDANDSTPYKKFNRVAMLPQKEYQLIITEYNAQGQAIQTNSYYIHAPKDPLTKELGDAEAKTYNIDFIIVGVI